MPESSGPTGQAGASGTGDLFRPNISAAGPIESKDPFIQQIAAWFVDLARATKGLRVYAKNNTMLQQFLDRAHAGLLALFERDPELSLTVREDRLLYGKEPVYINADREEGIPWILYRNAFRRITFVSGMTQQELVELLEAIATDYSGFDYAGEDLVTTLWRLALPHLRYLTIDAMSVEAKKASTGERAEINRIQADVEGIVAAIYKTSAPEDDIVAGVSITKEDLEALKELAEEDPEDLEALDQWTDRAITDVAEEELIAAQSSLARDSHDALAEKTMSILIELLCKEQSGKQSATTMDLLQRLFDSLLLSQKFEAVTRLVRGLQGRASDMADLQAMHVSRQLLRLFASEQRVAPVLGALNDGYSAASVSQMLAFLRALGPPMVPVLLDGLEMVNSPTHRRVVCDLIAELGVPSADELHSRLEGAKWFVARDLLALAQKLRPEDISSLVAEGLEHDHPKVRQQAVGMLRGYRRGIADRLVAARLADRDADVRLTAIRVAALRKSPEAKVAIEKILESDDLPDRGSRELRMLMVAYATLAGRDAVNALEKVLNPGFFSGLRNPEPQIAAAFALRHIGTEPALAALQRGARTLNPKVRDACKKALGQDEEKKERGEGQTTADLLQEQNEGEDDPLASGPAFIVRDKGQPPPPPPKGLSIERVPLPKRPPSVRRPHPAKETMPETTPLPRVQQPDAPRVEPAPPMLDPSELMVVTEDED